MDAEVGALAEQPHDRFGHAAEPELQCRAVGHQRGDLLGDLSFDRARFGALELGHLAVQIDQPVELFGLELARAEAVGQVGVDLADHQRRGADYVNDAADRCAQRVASVGPRRGDLRQHSIGRQRAVGREQRRHLRVGRGDVFEAAGLLRGAQRRAGLVGGEAKGCADVVERGDRRQQAAAGELELHPAAAQLVKRDEQSERRAGEGGHDDAGAVGDLAQGVGGATAAANAPRRAGRQPGVEAGHLPGPSSSRTLRGLRSS